jgi:cobalamin biosynthesis protein CobD/CbiB
MIIKNKHIPVKGFSAMSVWPLMFVRKQWVAKIKRVFPNVWDGVYTKMLNHEAIHAEQQREVTIVGLVIMLLIGFVFGFSWWLVLIPLLLFYVLYVLIWLWHLAVNTHFENPKDAYRRICFEREAYEGQEYTMYLAVRKPFAWLKHILKKD